MPRPPDGTTSKERTRTALFAYIAARLHGRQAKADEDALFGQLGLNVSSTAAQNAARHHRQSFARPALRKWLLIDEPRLDLDVAVLRFEGCGHRQQGLVETLNEMPGLRQILELSGSFEVLAVAIFDGRVARGDLKARVQEATGLDPAWFDIERESWAPSTATWAALAQRAADKEGLQMGDQADPRAASRHLT